MKIMGVKQGLGVALCMAFGQAAAHHCADWPENAKEKSLLPLYYEALLIQESGGKQFGGPSSVARPNEPTQSPSNPPAFGIAQMKITTAIDTANKHDIPWSEDDFLKNERYNKLLGWLYFEEVWEAFGCDINRGLASYNWGRGNLSKALKATQNEDWKNIAPAETQKYIMDINRRAESALRDHTGLQLSEYSP